MTWHIVVIPADDMYARGRVKYEVSIMFLKLVIFLPWMNKVMTEEVRKSLISLGQ